MKRLAIAFATLTFLLAACGAESPGGADPTDADPGRAPDLTPSVDEGTNGAVPQEMVADLLEQAAAETGVPIDEISLVTAEAVTWSDGSLGCPEPGMAYTQALVPGYRVVLDVAGEEIHFHAGQDGRFAACDNPQEPIDDGTLDR